jgi:hypothetical protein
MRWTKVTISIHNIYSFTYLNENEVIDKHANQQQTRQTKLRNSPKYFQVSVSIIRHHALQ